MVPPPRLRWGIASRQHSIAPVRLTASAWFQRPRSRSATGPTCPTTLALFTSTSRPPSAASAPATMRRTSVSTPMSPCSTAPWPPAASISAHTAARGPSRRPHSATTAPSRAKRRAMPRPMPLPPPVIRAALPASLPVFCAILLLRPRPLAGAPEGTEHPAGTAARSVHQPPPACSRSARRTCCSSTRPRPQAAVALQPRLVFRVRTRIGRCRLATRAARRHRLVHAVPPTGRHSGQQRHPLGSRLCRARGHE